ncbi:MAG: NADH-quinone oxidoreductase subunit M, partial [Candidatus Goldbacteria bacterium]|nr:NADH-quinone oxidoreductase subunit M [Candidatus Goldiibacteriota bacterium]
MEIFSFIKHIPVLTIIYLMPLISVLILLFIPGNNHRAIRLVALIPVCFSFFLSILLLINYDYNLGGLQFVEKHTWIPSLGINYFLGVNGINVALVLLTGFVIVAGVLASWDITYRPKEFFMLLLTLVTGVFGVFMTYNLFLF